MDGQGQGGWQCAQHHLAVTLATHHQNDTEGGLGAYNAI